MTRDTKDKKNDNENNQAKNNQNETNEETKHEDIILKNWVLTIMARHNVI